MSVFRSTLENQFVTALTLLLVVHHLYTATSTKKRFEDEQRVSVEGKMKMRSDKWKFMFDRQLILGDSFQNEMKMVENKKQSQTVCD